MPHDKSFKPSKRVPVVDALTGEWTDDIEVDTTPLSSSPDKFDATQLTHLHARTISAFGIRTKPVVIDVIRNPSDMSCVFRLDAPLNVLNGLEARMTDAEIYEITKVPGHQWDDVVSKVICKFINALGDR